jgi:hypothetical protein
VRSLLVLLALAGTASAEVAYPDGAMITAVPLSAASTDRGEQLIIRAREYRLAAIRAQIDGDETRDPARKARAELRSRLASRLANDAYRRALPLLEPAGPLRRRVHTLVLRRMAQAQLGLDADADATASALIALCSTCRESYDAHLHLADSAFAAADLSSAFTHYRTATQSPDTQLRAYAHYKLAWVLFNLSDLPAALDHLDRAHALASTLGPRGTILARESARDALRFRNGEPLD